MAKALQGRERGTKSNAIYRKGEKRERNIITGGGAFMLLSNWWFWGVCHSGWGKKRGVEEDGHYIIS